ncbi:MAG: tRNA 2-thiouridine(34) synthase MnmA [Mycoplasmatales bacterium]
MKTVVVGLSGGVDSSVSAYLLKEAGYNVIGVFMQNWDSALNNDLADPYIDREICQAQEDFEDAKAVADKLGIPIHRVNFVKEYWDHVFEYFLEEYRKGRTPNPDIMCNKHIKFSAFFDYALKKFDCDYIAMGHYAQIEYEPTVSLVRGADVNKDQTYFLEQVAVEILEKTLFPIGHLEKSEVREIAKAQGLITAEKKDSTGICFIGERHFANFLTNYLHEHPGDIREKRTDTKLGEHKGLMYYTIGQRRGMNLGGNKLFPGAKWYVVGKDVSKNILYVADQSDESFMKSNEAIITDVNLINLQNKPILSCKFRYRSTDVKVLEYELLTATTIKIKYETTLNLAPGQACVFYHDKYCLGGGTIDQVFDESILKELV